MKVHQLVAKKDYPEDGIKKGDNYFKWKGRYIPTRRSLKKPRPSQLTSSEFWQAIFGMQEAAQDRVPDFDEIEDLIEEMKSELETISAEQEDKKSSLPDNFQEAGPGAKLTERSEACGSCVSDLDSIDTTGEFDGMEGDELAQAKEDRAFEIWGEVVDALSNISCE